ncbi:MAG TPA: hypothetical protein VF807_11280 [Ktedonobacterales bacterium]
MDEQRRPARTIRLSRRKMLVVAGGGVAAVASVTALYRGLASLSPPPLRGGPPKRGYPIGQYQIAEYGVRTAPDPESAVQVDIPPVWSLVITALLAHPPTLAGRQRLEAALRAVEAAYPYAPSGVFMVMGYGLPFFRAHVRPQTFAAHLPRMADTGMPALLDAIAFPSDPATLKLEANDVVLHLRSDTLDHLHDVQHALFGRSGTLAGRRAPDADLTGLLSVTSVRSGFVGRGLPRHMAKQAHLAVADQIPEAAPLFMGFTSSQHNGQAHEEAVSFDGRRHPLLAPLTTALPTDYFAGGTTMHLSHLTENLDAWYAISYNERLARMFDSGAVSREGRVTVETAWLNPNPAEVHASQTGIIGHNEAIQRGSRSPEGQALQMRADFNTMDALDGQPPAPGVHFVAFTAGSQIFHQSRLAMDGVDITEKHTLQAHGNGINDFIQAMRRQNFLVPPRAHRAFPLIEIDK